MTSNPMQPPPPAPLTLEEAYKKLGELLQTQSPYTKTNLLELHLQNTSSFRSVDAEVLKEPTSKMKEITREMNRLVQETHNLARSLESLADDLDGEVSP